ncbi:hypothetical protein [Bradyrhizobium sp. BWA-3-5]|uniref:hypothetical protein n=1 Tax=Bradyrhizobium sp. BWA-3-5 TaxID=3080013 RepID=UPI00293EDAF6|nr:hypothetical protein [Bradyrhizobium sp. BWA-3-5]WOH63811.1 hypothetical protein RX331_24310 [Bradyrhizobium sp. BWA-3-5]
MVGDEHITADYTLLERELHRDNPDLAARMRFARPAVAQLLRSTECETDFTTAFLTMVDDQHKNDTAYFLFVPVNDGHGEWRR